MQDAASDDGRCCVLRSIFHSMLYRVVSRMVAVKLERVMVIVFPYLNAVSRPILTEDLVSAERDGEDRIVKSFW